MKKILLRLIIYSFLFFAAVVIFVFTYFLFNKEQIAENLLLGLNDEIAGEVSFKGVYLDPIVQFPKISLALNDFYLYENKDSIRSVLEDPIAEFENVYAAFDIFELFDEKITITQLLFSNGYIDITKYSNKIHNFEIALGKKKRLVPKKIKESKEGKKKGKRYKKKKLKKKAPFISKTLKLKLRKISLQNVHFEYNNQRNGKQSNLFFYDVIASLTIMPDSIRTKLYAKTEIKDLQISKQLDFGDLGLELNTSLKLKRNDSILLVEPSQLFISRAEFNMQGKIDLKKDGFIDLKIEGADKKLGFLSLLLSESGIENLKTGSLFFDGSLKGRFEDEIPELSVDFGIRDLSLKIPGNNDSIKHLNISGEFISGKKEDLSDAILKLDTLKAEVPEGFLDGKLQIQNFSELNVEYEIELLANVTGFENIFRQNYIDSLAGSIKLKDKFKGRLDARKGWFDEKKGNLRLKFDSVSFVIPGRAKEMLISGHITDENNKLHLRKINIRSGNTDLQINGTIKNLSNLVFNDEKKIVANLAIQSRLFDFPDFFRFDSAIGESFPYQIRNINLSLSASSTKKELFEFNLVPRIKFKIRKLSAKVDSLLGPFQLKNGQLLISDYNDGMMLDIKNFTINSGKGKILLNAYYLHDQNNKDQLKIESNIMRLGLIDVLDKALIDSSMEAVSTPVDARVKSSFSIERGEKIVISELEFFANNINYRGAKKKIRIDDLEIKSNAMEFDDNSKGISFSDFAGQFSLQVGKIRSKDYNFKDIVYSIDAEKGKFTLIPKNDSLLGVKASGKFIISPFEEPPSYSFDYSLHQFSMGELFVNFLEDSVLSGRMSLNVKLDFKGSDKETIVKTLNGKIKLQGKNLTLYGANVDDFLKKYEETKDFNLLDIGVVIYAGPIGMLATKGGDFAKVKVTDRKKKSKIDRMISDWRIIGDSLIVEDVALRTGNNRIALKGWYSYKSDSLNFNIGVLDKKGCSILSQGFSGPSLNPQMSNLGLFTKIQLSDKKKKECKPFYTGRLEHPIKK